MFFPFTTAQKYLCMQRDISKGQDLPEFQTVSSWGVSQGCLFHGCLSGHRRVRWELRLSKLPRWSVGFVVIPFNLAKCRAVKKGITYVLKVPFNEGTSGNYKSERKAGGVQVMNKCMIWKQSKDSQSFIFILEKTSLC